MNGLTQTVTRKVARSILTTKKNSPHIFFVAGLAGVLTSTFLACKATLKLDKTLDETKNDLMGLQGLKARVGTISEGELYREKDYYQDLGYVYTKSAINFSKLYGPACVLGGISIAALTGSHIQLSRRNAALTFTLAAVSKAYEDYRSRVQQEIGQERELELHRAISDQKVEIDGKKQLVKVTDPNGWSPYARFFDESSPNWQKDAELNRIFLQCQQTYANHLLRARGHIFLNEIYDCLGMERSQAGVVVGWVVNGNGDGFVDFGLFEVSSSPFINNFERSVILDFNVDGVIYDKI